MAKAAPEERDEFGVAAAHRDNIRMLGRRGAVQSPAEALQPQPAPPPPARLKRKRRGGILSAISGCITFLLVLAIAGVAALSYGARWYFGQGPLAADKVVYIPAGTNRGEMVELLEREGVIDNSLALNAAFILNYLRRGATPQADEYVFRSHASPEEVLATLTECSAKPDRSGPPPQGKPTCRLTTVTLKEGQSVADLKALDHSAHLRRSITLREGWTSAQIVQWLKDNEFLLGDVHLPAEGTLMPDTYVFSRGLHREVILKEMQDRQRKVVNEVWASRAPDLPLKSISELVTLASMIEKETGKPEERARIAAVFVNRLNKHMRLESDPTVIYGITLGRSSLGRDLTTADLKKPTPYNTYVIDGLPPGPITNPGQAALEAAANPEHTKELYFVADGTGGHAFAETLEEHKKNVERWRKLRDNKLDPAKAPTPSTPPTPEPPKPPQKTELDGDRLARGAGPAAESSALPANGLLEFGRFKVNVGPSIDAVSWRIEGIDMGDDAEPMLSGGDGEGASHGPATYPLSPAQLADLRAREARYGLDVATSSKVPHGVFGAEDERATSSPCPNTPRTSAARRGGVDASEGTPLDPLRNRTFDLNSAKIVPSASALLTALTKLDRLVRADLSRELTCTDNIAGKDTPPTKAANSDAGEGPRTGVRIFDASEGTTLDPLRNKTYDLNSPQVIPTKTIAFAGVESTPPEPLPRPAGKAFDGEGRPASTPRGTPIYDASEGTKFDPLLEKNYDLNSPHAVPDKPITIAALEQPVSANPASATDATAVGPRPVEANVPLPVARPLDDTVRTPTSSLVPNQPAGLSGPPNVPPATARPDKLRTEPLEAALVKGPKAEAVQSLGAPASRLQPETGGDVRTRLSEGPKTAGAKAQGQPPRATDLAGLVARWQSMPAGISFGLGVALGQAGSLMSGVTALRINSFASKAAAYAEAKSVAPTPAVAAGTGTQDSAAGALPRQPAAPARSVSAALASDPASVPPTLVGTAPAKAPAATSPANNERASLVMRADPATGRSEDPQSLLLAGPALAPIKPATHPRPYAPPAWATSDSAKPGRSAPAGSNLDRSFDLNSSKVVPDL